MAAHFRSNSPYRSAKIGLVRNLLTGETVIGALSLPIGLNQISWKHEEFIRQVKSKYALPIELNQISWKHHDRQSSNNLNYATLPIEFKSN